MELNKAEMRQAIIDELGCEYSINGIKQCLFSYAQLSLKGSIADAILSRLSELQPKPSAFESKYNEPLFDTNKRLQLYIDENEARWNDATEPKPVNKTDEELVNEIIGLFVKKEEFCTMYYGKIVNDKYEYIAKNAYVIAELEFESVAREIASILPRREADKELLEALHKIMNLNAGGEITGNESWFVAQEAIKNYRK